MKTLKETREIRDFYSLELAELKHRLDKLNSALQTENELSKLKLISNELFRISAKFRTDLAIFCALTAISGDGDGTAWEWPEL